MIDWEAVDRAIQKTKSNFGYKKAEYDEWCRLNDVKLKCIHDVAIAACTNKKEKKEMANNNLYTAFLSRYPGADGEDIPQIKNVIFNPPATIVFWKDGTKTVVKAENEEFDAEKGLAMAFSKKFLGNKYDYYNTFKRWLKRAPDYKKEK